MPVVHGSARPFDRARGAHRGLFGDTGELYVAARPRVV
jgi:hypothetical protein